MHNNLPHAPNAPNAPIPNHKRLQRQQLINLSKFRLTFEHIDGTEAHFKSLGSAFLSPFLESSANSIPAEDPYSPHIIKFPESWNAPTINQLQVSALDLTLWYDIRLGASRLKLSCYTCLCRSPCCCICVRSSPLLKLQILQ